jgi:hypothetical protein
LRFDYILVLLLLVAVAARITHLQKNFIVELVAIQV